MTLQELIATKLEAWEVVVSESCPIDRIVVTEGLNLIEVPSQEQKKKWEDYIKESIETAKKIKNSPLGKALL